MTAGLPLYVILLIGLLLIFLGIKIVKKIKFLLIVLGLLLILPSVWGMISPLFS